MGITKEIIQRQSVLKEWFEHANRQCEIKDEYKEGFKREFENLIESGNKLAQMLKIERLDLLCDITDGSPQNEYLARELKEKWLIHLDDSDMSHKLRFFNSLLENKIISFKEHSEAYHLAHVLNWQMESNAIAAKQALKDAGYYNDTQQDNPKAEEQMNEGLTIQDDRYKPLAEERKVDEEAVGSWFKAKFKGAGGNTNHLQDLLADLKRNRSNKEFAKIAYLIHSCESSTVHSKTFSKFYADFCNAVGCEQKKYEPCKLKDEEFAKTFYYLQ